MKVGGRCSPRHHFRAGRAHTKVFDSGRTREMPRLRWLLVDSTAV
jgi:hypothetical protein